MTRLISQNERVLNTLRTTGSITENDASRRNIKCLSARICQLRNSGVRINTVVQAARGHGARGPEYVLA